MKALITSAVLITVFCSLSGCMNPGKNLIPQGGDMTMSEIYHSEGAQSSNDSHPRALGKTLKTERAEKYSDYRGYSASAKNEINNLFHKLPNPQVVIYIYPHMVESSGERYPKPGFSSAFYLYRQNHFAQDWEQY